MSSAEQPLCNSTDRFLPAGFTLVPGIPEAPDSLLDKVLQVRAICRAENLRVVFEDNPYIPNGYDGEVLIYTACNIRTPHLRLGFIVLPDKLGGTDLEDIASRYMDEAPDRHLDACKIKFDIAHWRVLLHGGGGASHALSI